MLSSITRWREPISAHLFLLRGARGVSERVGVARFIGRQALRLAGRDVGPDTTVRFRGMAYVVDQSSELHTLVEVHRDRYYSRAAGFVPHGGTTVLDLGANVGVFALSHAAAGAQVLAVEPNPGALARLQRAAADNGLAERITAVSAAVGADPGFGRLEVPDGVSVLGNVVAAGGAPADGAGSVRIVTVDGLATEHGIEAVDLLKIDVEGAEADVLRGAHATLPRVRRVILEYHSPRLLAEVREQLGHAGFHEVMEFAASGEGAGMLYAERDASRA